MQEAPDESPVLQRVGKLETYTFSKDEMWKSSGGALFLIRQEKYPKEADIGEALRTKAPSPMYPSRRFAGTAQNNLIWNV